MNRSTASVLLATVMLGGAAAALAEMPMGIVDLSVDVTHSHDARMVWTIPNNLIYAPTDDFASGWAMSYGWGTGQIDNTVSDYDFGTDHWKVTGIANVTTGLPFLTKRAFSSNGPVLAGQNFRLVYRVLDQGLMRCTATKRGMKIVFSQDLPFDDAPNNYTTVISYMPVTPGWHEVIWNAAVAAPAGSGDVNAPITGIVLRADADNGVNTSQVVFCRLERWPAETGQAWVLLGLDDAHYTQAQAALYAISKGIPCYIAVATDKCGVDPDYLDWNTSPSRHPGVPSLMDLQAAGVQLVQHYRAFPYTGTDEQKRAYLQKAKSDLVQNGVTGFGKDVYVIPAGTEGIGTGNRPTMSDILLMRQYNCIVRGTVANWTGAGSDADYYQIGLGSQARAMPKRKPNAWWIPCCPVSDSSYINVPMWLANAKAHGACVSIYSHRGVTNDISEANWEAMCDVIGAAISAGDAKGITFENYYLANVGICWPGQVGLGSYDVRYATSPITDANWDSASQATAGVRGPSMPPKLAGQEESFIVTGLQGNTTYYFGVKTIDAFGNRSPLSNIVSAATTADPDTTPPRWIGDLKGRPSGTAKGVDLTWTAPADYGPNGTGPIACVIYDLRWSTSRITDDTAFDAATQISSLPAPKAPGQSESFTVALAEGGTTYYFAIKCVDGGVPPNTSEVSNCAAAKTSVIGNKVLQMGLDGYSGTNLSYYAVDGGGYPSDERMMVCGFGATNVRRGITRFDVTGQVPDGVTVTSATLSLYSDFPGDTKGSTGFYGLYPVTSDWIDTQVDWNLAKPGVNWITPGGDFLPTPDALSPKLAPAAVPAWYTWDVTSRVQSWLAGTSTNYGWIVKCANEENSNQDCFYQEDVSTTAYRPKLILSDLATRKVGDTNGDGYVNIGDLQALVGCWGKSVSDRGYEPWIDLNEDSFISVGDLQILVAHWNQ